MTTFSSKKQYYRIHRYSERKWCNVPSKHKNFILCTTSLSYKYECSSNPNSQKCKNFKSLMRSHYNDECDCLRRTKYWKYVWDRAIQNCVRKV